MGIAFYEDKKVFKLDTPASTYIISVIDDEQFLAHTYWGKSIDSYNINYALRLNEPPYVPSSNARDRVSFLDSFPAEYSTGGVGDFRESSLELRSAQGHSACSLTYAGHEIYKGKREIAGLPSSYGDDNECTSLVIKCVDSVISAEVLLSYTVFEHLDVITRHVTVKNMGAEAIYLTKALSMCVDMNNANYEMLTLHGSWARERNIQREKLGYGKKRVSSLRGESGHQEHPFFAVVEPNATQKSGDVFGFSLIYSGNFMAQAELSQFDTIRCVMGIHPDGFNWQLCSKEAFSTPEAVLVFSGNGLGQMTRTFHDFFRNNLISKKYLDFKRPVLINSWEAAYFNFDTERLIGIAKESSKLGIELFVLDDGWFGNRNDDNSSLGDWHLNKEKIPQGLRYLSDEINALGMQFGIWMEPEMVSPNSELFVLHPEWALYIPGRKAALSRNQYVLDLSNPDVIEYVYSCIKTTLTGANIAYLKWDMNRPLTDLGSSYLPYDRQGELAHRYVLGLYELQRRLVADFPDLLLENCSSGGARFDPGMLYYSPQIWCSDDTDAIERLKIQEGTALVYPLSCIGAHVSACPNHTVGRVTPFETRGYIALAGTFGYELDVTKLSDDEKSAVRKQVSEYHRYNALIRTGDYYRIASFSDNHEFDCWQIVSKDKCEALLTYIQVLAKPHVRSKNIKFTGLDENGIYMVNEKKYTGLVLMNVGIFIEAMSDFHGVVFHAHKI